MDSARLKLPKKLGLENFSRDVMLADQLGSRLQRPPVQLELLSMKNLRKLISKRHGVLATSGSKNRRSQLPWRSGQRLEWLVHFFGLMWKLMCCGELNILPNSCCLS